MTAYTNAEWDEYDNYRWEWLNRHSDVHTLVKSIIDYADEGYSLSISPEKLSYEFEQSAGYLNFVDDDMEDFLNELALTINLYIPSREHFPVNDFIEEWENNSGIYGEIWSSIDEFFEEDVQ